MSRKLLISFIKSTFSEVTGKTLYRYFQTMSKATLLFKCVLVLDEEM